MASRNRALSEESIASVVVSYLESRGADIYQEVEVSGGVADIVAVVSHETWIIEVKTSLSLALLYQAMERRRIAHRVFVAAPYSRNCGDAERVFTELGLGLWIVHDTASGYGEPGVQERVHSRRWNTKPVRLRSTLRPEHKTHARAGSVGAGGRWTRFTDTCEQLSQIVILNPGITLKEAVAQIRHHYRTPRSAMSSLVHWIEMGKVPRVRVERDAGVTRLQPLPETSC